MACCQDYIELISAAVDGALSPGERALLDAHLSSCPACQALYADLSALHASFADLSRARAEPPEDLTERIVAAVAADNVTPLPAKKTGLLHWRRWAACAAVLAVVLLGASRLDLGRSGGASADAAPAQATVNGEAQYKSAVTADQAAPAEAPAAGEPQAEAVQEAPVEAETAGAPGAMPDGGAEKNAPLSAAPAEAETVPANALPLPDPSETFTGDFGGVQPFRGAAEQPPAPSEVPAPSEAAAAQEPEGVTEEAAGRAPLTPAEALDRLLAEKGFTGWESRGDDWVTWPRDGETQDHLVYDGLSENGKYYVFISYRGVYDSEDADTPGHNSRNGAYAVPLDGGDILEEAGPEFWALLAGAQ